MEGIKFIRKLKYSWQKVSAQIIYETEILEVQEKWEVMQLMELAKPKLSCLESHWFHEWKFKEILNSQSEK